MRANLILLVTMCASGACGYVLVKLLEEEVTPLTMAAGRALIGGIVILVFCLIAGHKLLPPLRDWWRMLIIGVLGVGMLWVTASLGEKQVDAQLASLLICVIPIATLLIIALPPKPVPVRWPAWIGAAIATIGLAVAIDPRQLFDQPSALGAVLIITLGFTTFALANVLVEAWTKGYSPAAVGGVAMLMAAVMLWILAGVLEEPSALRPSGKAWLQLLGLGVLGGAVPVLLMFALIHRAGAGFASLYGFGLPVFGIILGAIVFKRPPGWTLYVGALIAFGGVALLQWSRRRDGAEAALARGSGIRAAS